MSLHKFKVLGNQDTRSGFGLGLVEVGRKNKNVVALCADLTESVKMNGFKAEFPDRFFQVGIAEANMMSIAAGLAVGGKMPFTGTFANFTTSRVYDQVRQSVAYSNNNVKICGSHSGISLGEDGATHQVLEDIGMMKGLPNMVVINPCDYNQTRAATIAIAKIDSPIYLRYGRPKVPVFIPEDMPFEIGKAIVLRGGSDVTIIATGHMVWETLEASNILAEMNISAEVINVHTIKPLDSETILKSVSKTRCIVTAEEHMVNNGLGDSVAQLMAKHQPTPQEYVAVDDTFGESGSPFELMKKYGLDKNGIINNVKKVLKRKQ